ncbi:paraquat-inducible protein A [Rhodanobacter sp. A1T4]|uniref:paraquat-inducible protein A n=1 Tax=Rhodanobacter sp. A1T4 TaxID=2723087 RepID=UPI00160F4066|nr:paraquat-inducible protein A [Rhodanobacter sp. A1T4]MBB6245050.1 paraquat-inducible protein A [Rhodanobacter sp. A1T4]
MKTFPHLIVCEHCDTVYRRVSLESGDAARCVDCAATLYRANRMNVDGWLALTVTAAIALVMANVCPVIRISLHGQHNEVTLWQSVAALGHGAAAPIAVPAALSVIVVPGLQILLLGWVLAFARAGHRAPGFAMAMKVLATLRPWSMVEVAMLGILISIIKLSNVVQVTPGDGVWATAGLMVLITLIASRDIHWLWGITDNHPLRGRQGV